MIQATAVPSPGFNLASSSPVSINSSVVIFNRPVTISVNIRHNAELKTKLFFTVMEPIWGDIDSQRPPTLSVAYD